jgi:hypothetical protein
MQRNEDSMAEECIGETILASIAHFGRVHGTISTFHLVSLITTPLEMQHFIQKALVAASDVIPIAHVGNPKCVLIWEFPEGNGTSHEHFFCCSGTDQIEHQKWETVPPDGLYQLLSTLHGRKRNDK